MRVGLLSTANINHAVLGGAAASEGAAEVVAVASRDEARARAYADEHGIARAHGSYDALLADPEVDAVYVSLPNQLHVDWAIRAVQAGKHVLCEKPLTRDPERAAAAYDAAEAAGRVLVEGFMWRYAPQAVRLLERLPEVGRVRLVRAAFAFGARDPDDVRLSPDLEGGGLMDVGCYCVSAARLVLGEPVAASGQRITGGGGVDVLFAGALRFEDDALAIVDCAMTTAKRGALEVVGEDGTLTLTDPWHGKDPRIERRDADGTLLDTETPPAANAYALELQELADVAAGLRPARFGRADAIGQARALGMLHAAAGGS